MLEPRVLGLLYRDVPTGETCGDPNQCPYFVGALVDRIEEMVR